MMSLQYCKQVRFLLTEDHCNRSLCLFPALMSRYNDIQDIHLLSLILRRRFRSDRVELIEDIARDDVLGVMAEVVGLGGMCTLPW